MTEVSASSQRHHRSSSDQKACNIKSGSGVPNKTKVATITKAQVEEIAKTKMPDLNAATIESAMSMVEGTCRSMGVTVTE